MNYTSNYKFKLPSATDVIDITVLNSNFADIDKKIAQNEQKTALIQLSDTLEIVSASGTVSFYHGTLTPFTSILNSVKTTWGDAVFRNKYGTISTSAGSTISLSITIEVVDGVIYWDEYYNDEDGGEKFTIGTATLTKTSTGDTTCSFNYINDDAGESKKLELREAVLELAKQIQALRKG